MRSTFTRITIVAFLCLAYALPLAETAAAEAGSAQPQAPGPLRVFQFDAEYLQSARQQLRAGNQSLAPALARLERDAQAALDAGPFSVVSKKVTPPSGDKHDYMSQAPYFWPNPNTTNGLPYVRRDGERNPEINRISDHRRLDQMAEAVETLALAFYFKGDETCADRAARLLRAWFFEPATRMNPNLQYAQAVLGVNNGRSVGLIESRGLTRVVDAVGLLAGAKAWTPVDQSQLQDWFAQFLRWMQESKNGREEAAAKNNHGTWYDVQAVSFALFLGKVDFATDTVRTAREKRLAVQIQPDGQQPLELARTKAWSYSVMNLSGLMSLATLSDRVGVDLWRFQTSDGRSLGKALDYLAPFALGQQKWPHRQLGGWPPEILSPLLRQAAMKLPDRKYREWVKQLPPVEPTNRSNLLSPKGTEQLGASK